MVWSQDWGLCLRAPFRYLKVRARFSAQAECAEKRAVTFSSLNGAVRHKPQS